MKHSRPYLTILFVTLVCCSASAMQDEDRATLEALKSMPGMGCLHEECHGDSAEALVPGGCPLWRRLCDGASSALSSRRVQKTCLAVGAALLVCQMIDAAIPGVVGAEEKPCEPLFGGACVYDSPSGIYNIDHFGWKLEELEEIMRQTVARCFECSGSPDFKQVRIDKFQECMSQEHERLGCGHDDLWEGFRIVTGIWRWQYRTCEVVEGFENCFNAASAAADCFMDLIPWRKWPMMRAYR